MSDPLPPSIDNVYADRSYADRYAALDWQGTYYLLKRDLPDILKRAATGTRALDFGCGAGRSTRLLRSLGFDAMGIDVSEAMVLQAQALDPGHDYRVVENGDFTGLEPASFDLILACFPFDNIPGDEQKITIMAGLQRLLSAGGIFVNIVSSSDIYRHEWTTFTTAPFPENLTAEAGDVVRIITKDFAGQPVCEDILCDDDTYRRIYREAGLVVVGDERPLGRPDDPVDWVSETAVAPWVIWILRSDSDDSASVAGDRQTSPH
ncbi:MAG: hypothetical protein HONBIEJF_00775 [Fimbriimonadaceae bacterium]|nr:hypothetical protein [Fimbriimonadaceae bacterium]